jgi:hypothetical protein
MKQSCARLLSALGLALWLVAIVCMVTMAFAALACGAIAPPTTSLEVAEQCYQATVTVFSSGGQGTGVSFAHGDRRFIWTDAHVVSDSLKKEKVLLPGKDAPTIRYRFTDVYVGQDEFVSGRKVGRYLALARVIRYSDAHDLAILEPYKRGWPEASVRFQQEGLLPRLGEHIWHVGGLHGERGGRSVLRGNIAAIGRTILNTIPEELEDPLVYDQVNVMAAPGCSGGGIFDAHGRCLGLIARYVGPGAAPAGGFLYTPTRRMWAFSRQAGCLWAMDRSVAVPLDHDRVVYQDPIVLEVK